jgi:hypothetical protein
MTPLFTSSATLLLFALLATGCAKNDDATPAIDTNDNLAIGNPSCRLSIGPTPAATSLQEKAGR